MVIAEVHLEHPAIPLSPTLESDPDRVVYWESPPVNDEDTLWLFFSVEQGSFDDLDDALRRDTTVSESRLIADFDSRRIFRTKLTDAAKLITPTLARLGIQILEVHSEDGGWFLRLQLPERAALVAFRKYCEEEDIESEVKTLYLKEEAESRGGFGLTAAQREALIIAHERGYFDDPRDITLQKLADEMGISSAALGRRLRRGTNKLIAETLRSQ